MNFTLLKMYFIQCKINCTQGKMTYQKTKPKIKQWINEVLSLPKQTMEQITNIAFTLLRKKP